jgi:hypothetical protein
MRFLILPGALIVLSVLFLVPVAHAQFEVPPGPFHGFPAVDVDGGIACASRGTDWTYLGRASVGLHLVNRQRVAAFTGGFEMLGSSHKAFSLRAELASIKTGLGIGGGPTMSTHGDPGVNLGVGLSVLHLEGILVFGDHSERAIVAYLRLPLGLIAYSLWGRRD